MEADATAIPWAAAVVADGPPDARELSAQFADCAQLAYRVAHAVLHTPEEAQDVVQEAFLRAHRSFGSLRDPERFRGWITRTVFRLALDRQRGERRRRSREQTVGRDSDPSLSAEEELDRVRLRRRVSDAVGELPPKLRIVTLLAAMEGHELRDVAKLLDLPEGTVKSRLHRARRVLAEKLRCLI